MIALDTEINFFKFERTTQIFVFIVIYTNLGVPRRQPHRRQA